MDKYLFRRVKCAMLCVICIVPIFVLAQTDSLTQAPMGALKQQLLATDSFSSKPWMHTQTVHLLPLFCRWEKQLQTATRMPVKIRVGEVQAVDKKEGYRRQMQTPH